MSYMKRLVDDIMYLYGEGRTISEIAAILEVDRDEVEIVVEEYSNYYS
jgi:DNA-directed RNA polymerase specialized sigma24 family protein